MTLSWLNRRLAGILPGMRTHRPLLARVALAATVFLALASGAETLYLAVEMYGESRISSPSTGPARVSDQDERLRPLREHLPPRGFVGYASDGLAGNSFTSVEALQDYFLTQYALAPVIILRTTDLPIVVGNYSVDSAADSTGARTYPAGLVVLRDLDSGVVLLVGAER